MTIEQCLDKYVENLPKRIVVAFTILDVKTAFLAGAESRELLDKSNTKQALNDYDQTS